MRSLALIHTTLTKGAVLLFLYTLLFLMAAPTVFALIPFPSILGPVNPVRTIVGAPLLLVRYIVHRRSKSRRDKKAAPQPAPGAAPVATHGETPGATQMQPHLHRPEGHPEPGAGASAPPMNPNASRPPVRSPVEAGSAGEGAPASSEEWESALVLKTKPEALKRFARRRRRPSHNAAESGSPLESATKELETTGEHRTRWVQNLNRPGKRGHATVVDGHLLSQATVVDGAMQQLLMGAAASSQPGAVHPGAPGEHPEAAALPNIQKELRQPNLAGPNTRSPRSTRINKLRAGREDTENTHDTETTIDLLGKSNSTVYLEMRVETPPAEPEGPGYRRNGNLVGSA